MRLDDLSQAVHRLAAAAHSLNALTSSWSATPKHCSAASGGPASDEPAASRVHPGACVSRQAAADDAADARPDGRPGARPEEAAMTSMTSTQLSRVAAGQRTAPELQPLVKNWGMMAGRGVLAVLFGAAIVLWRVPVFTAVIFSFGTYVIADGILAIASA